MHSASCLPSKENDLPKNIASQKRSLPIPVHHCRDEEDAADEDRLSEVARPAVVRLQHRQGAVHDVRQRCEAQREHHRRPGIVVLQRLQVGPVICPKKLPSPNFLVFKKSPSPCLTVDLKGQMAGGTHALLPLILSGAMPVDCRAKAPPWPGQASAQTPSHSPGGQGS